MNKENIKKHHKTLLFGKTLFFSLFFIFFSITTVFSQEESQRDIVYLKNGEVFTGEIVIKTDDFVVMQTKEGKRFQFPISEIERINKEKQKSEKSTRDSARNFSGIVDLEGGFGKASTHFYGNSPLLATTISLGSRDFLGSKMYAGIGTGVEFFISQDPQKKLTLLPIFIQLQKNLSNSPIKPFIGAKTGYSFSLNNQINGGLFFRLNGGINLQVSESTSFNIGLFGKIQQISGMIIEKNVFGEFTKQGTTPLYSAGINFSYQF